MTDTDSAPIEKKARRLCCTLELLDEYMNLEPGLAQIIVDEHDLKPCATQENQLLYDIRLVVPLILKRVIKLVTHELEEVLEAVEFEGEILSWLTEPQPANEEWADNRFCFMRLNHPQPEGSAEDMAAPSATS